MKVTIELTEAEVKGLKAYLAEVSGDINPKIGKEEIKQEIQGIVSSSLQTGAIWDYISQYQTH